MNSLPGHKMKSILAFDIATIPDIAGIRLLHDLPADLPDHDVAEFAFQRQRAQNGSDVLPLHLQRVLAVSCVLREGEHGLKVWSVGRAGDDETVILKTFFDELERHAATLVSWGGSRFVVPVLHSSALKQGISAPNYWNQIQDGTPFHLDLIDTLNLQQSRGFMPLDEMAKLSGFPGKLGIDTEKVWDAYQLGQEQSLRDYAQTKTLKTFLLYQRFRLLRGELTATAYATEMDLVRATINKIGTAQWLEFLNAWPLTGV